MKHPLEKPKGLLTRVNEAASSDIVKWAKIIGTITALVIALTDFYKAQTDRERVENWHKRQAAVNVVAIGSSNAVERIENAASAAQPKE